MSSFISGLSDLLRRKKITTPDYNAQSLFTVHSAKQLLMEPHRSAYLKKVNEIVKMPEEHFQSLYAKLVDNFVEFAQILPMRYSEHLSGIMQLGLRHALTALELLFETSPKKPQPIYVYAVFSMALLADLYKVIATQKVMVSDENGIYIDEWCPFTGSMVEQGAQFYKIREYGGYREAFLNSANPLLAQRVMPELGLRWLSSNPRIFDMWIAVLTGHEDWAGELGFLKKILKKKFLDEEKQLELWLEKVPMEFTEPEDTAIAEKFIEWLKDGIRDEKISVNGMDSFVHIIDGGIFIKTAEAFDTFMHTYSSYRDMLVLQNQLSALGITKSMGYDFRIEQFFAGRADTSSRLGFLAPHQKAQAANLKGQITGEQTNLELANQTAAAAKQNVHQKVDLAKHIHHGLIITDPAIIYNPVSAMPAVSTVMKDVSIHWVHEQSLPKVLKANQPSNILPPLLPTRQNNR